MIFEEQSKIFKTNNEGIKVISCRKCKKEYDKDIEAYQCTETKRYFLWDIKKQEITWI